ncbi:Collagenase [Frankliniella fusca]|uniref:Collagenase n=1 Tax=Frankliniella fusca TaxID=407009 RepID=A0AAE1HDS3_9NEOP|nr:Collagenase [Frankliniella fusca]
MVSSGCCTCWRHPIGLTETEPRATPNSHFSVMFLPCVIGLLPGNPRLRLAPLGPPRATRAPTFPLHLLPLSLALASSSMQSRGPGRAGPVRARRALVLVRMSADLVALLAALALAALSAPATATWAPPADLPPYSWSWRKIIRAVEGAAASVPIKVESQLIANLPTVQEVAAVHGGPGPGDPAANLLLPQPEVCPGCAPGTDPQPAEAGHVNSLLNKLSLPAATGHGAAREAPVKHRALPGQFPWHVSLLYKGLFYSCSGALVSDQWVLTAANCAHGYDSIVVRLGSYRPAAQQERFRTTLTCTHIVVHPGYRRGSPKDDIAAIRLPSPQKLNGFILPVRLPSRNSFTTTYADRSAWLSGWGVMSQLGTFRDATAVLGYAAETVLPNEKCAEKYSNVTTSSILCTTTGSFSSGCMGDSGAPLVVNEGGIFVHIGILSFVSAAGCTEGHPAGYTRITSYLRWIQNATGIAPGPDIHF